MSEAGGQPVDHLADTHELVGTYRCVCGELFPLTSDAAKCPTCGRHYDSEVLRDAAADTAQLAGADEAVAVRQDPREGEDPFIGERLGHFRILNRIGGGGMGAVYRALDESLQRYVALKVIRRTSDGDDQAEVQQLLQEARAQARVNHPHVAHIYYVGTEDETPFLAMELVGSHTLAHRLRYGAMTFPEVARFARQIAEALAHAAKFDIVHGDIKPSNILLVDHRTVKISDFGLARRLSEMGSHDGSGTPNYMSPEATLGKPTDHRSDMYSLGVTLFEMTFGKLPYTRRRGDLKELLFLHRAAPIEFPEVWPQEIPEAWRDVLSRLLAKEVKDRYANFDELIADLKKLQPVSLPNARPLLRFLAWFFDVFLLASPLGMAELAIQQLNLPVIRFFGSLAGALVPLGALYLQAWWGTTPGKRLCQIRIVDEHGLPPRKPVLALRAIFQFLWVWNIVLFNMLRQLGLDNLALTIAVIVFLFLMTEFGFVVFGKGRSLHDRFFGTRVVLDAAQAGTAQ